MYGQMTKITKEARLEIRLEKELKKHYVSTCKKNKTSYSKRIRDFIEKDLEMLKNEQKINNRGIY